MASSRERDEGPVYYREIQKNAYLKRIPNDVGGSKLRPLTSKKVPLKPMWTQLCVHNGKTPYLEQYPEANSPAAITHKPIWRASLRSARHVTASVKPHYGDQYDFLIDTDNGSIRMLAPDWESMQDWVTTLRNTLHELKILSRGENVYCSGPAPPPLPPPPRAAARDPTSPLPPTPPTPPDRVPGIELTTRPPETIPEAPEAQPEIEPTTSTEEENIDISNWDVPFTSLPSTSQNKVETRKSVAKICGQNICLDDSMFKRTNITDSDEEFFAEIDKMCSEDEYTQRVVVCNGDAVAEGSENGSVTVNAEINCNGDGRVQNNGGSDINRLRSVERARSQNAYDANRPREARIMNTSPRREIKNETPEQNHTQNKPIWKRGLTELSLLTRLKSIAQTKKENSNRHEENQDSRGTTISSPAKVVHRSRPEGRSDTMRRRSSSLSNADVPPSMSVPAALPALTPLRARQAACLRAEQRRGAALVATVNTTHPPVFTDYQNQVWIAWWGPCGVRASGRAGDRVAALASRSPRDALHARQLLSAANTRTVDILFHRVPLGKIYVVNKRDQEALGLKLDNECNITGVVAQSACARAGLPPPGNWALTEINNRPINLLKGGEEDMNRLSKHGTEVSILIQPSAFVKKLRSALKGNKTLLGLR
ncbi:hypothetical protein HW555_004957 [Spodoptera exigua]|uniref:PH domain-containing protein n=1 Tax=Spodoptera exigua TaxID=7107 RepID=A0A835GKR7_SPOEX|nr:hypothetical protein HW555_004957 [Spodoptera exigua]